MDVRLCRWLDGARIGYGGFTFKFFERQFQLLDLQG